MNNGSGNTNQAQPFMDDWYNVTDPDLDARIKAMRKAELLLDSILSDPELDNARNDSAMIISSRVKSADGSNLKNSSAFIKSSFIEAKKSINAHKEINNIRIELSKSDISSLSADWVREWHRKKQMEIATLAADAERKSFITSAMDSGKVAAPAITPVIGQSQTVQKPDARRTIIRYTALAAAAVAAILFTIKTLVPAGDFEKSFNAFYSPYNAVSSVSRSMGARGDSYQSAIAFYKSGNYTGAESELKGLIAEDPLNINAMFYLGLSQLETGKTDEAINNLSAVVNGTGNFRKEALWYLSLAHLKNGNRQKAAENLSILAESDNFYREASSRLLRRLR